MRGRDGWRPAQQRQAASRGSTERGRAFRSFGRGASARLGRAVLTAGHARSAMRASSAARREATGTAATRRAATTTGAITTAASRCTCPALRRGAAGQGSAHASSRCGSGTGGEEAVLRSGRGKAETLSQCNLKNELGGTGRGTNGAQHASSTPGYNS